MKFLTKEEILKKTDDGKFVMDGKTIGFVMNDRAYAAKLTISNMAVYLCQTRIACDSQCPDKKGMKFAWGIKHEQIPEYYMFDDEEILKQLVDIDLKVAEYYRDAEKQMADFDKDSVIAGNVAIKASLDDKREIAKKALETAQKQAEQATSVDGAENECVELQALADKRYNTTVESWNKGE